ncbi:MAG: hypothetical protein NTX03_08265 [Bacteroidetes bacterium]|nr:hypothetical protein [Bacteroidota bacterium]
MTFDKVLTEIMKMEIEAKETLMEIVHHRLVEEKRERIFSNAKKAKADFVNGKLKPMTITEAKKHLNSL